MGFIFVAPWQCFSRLMVLETADHDSSSNRKGRKSVSRLDREKDESSDWGRESISMVTTVMFFFFFPPSPHPHLYPSHLLSFFPPSSNVSVSCCYTISHLLMVFNWSSNWSHFLCCVLIKRSSELIKSVKSVCGWMHMRVHYNPKRGAERELNKPRIRHNELLIMCFGGSWHPFFLFCVNCLIPH